MDALANVVQSLPHCSDKNWSTLTERTCLAQRQLVIAFSVTNPATSRISRDGNLEDLRIFQFHYGPYSANAEWLQAAFSRQMVSVSQLRAV
jgi:hypothetical protein